MGIASYIKEIGRGREGARSLTREQACDLFGQLLDGTVSDLETGAFCLAMRIKGETALEMAGFLDATHQRLQRLPDAAQGQVTVVIPSYNGARKLPVLTPLLALLVARAGLPVLIHGMASESSRVYTSKVLEVLEIETSNAVDSITSGCVKFVPTTVLLPGLQRLLDVRRVVGLRNSAHSLVKLMSPCGGKNLVVSSYTHPEYALSMAATFEVMQTDALLLRGTEGESVADARRMPQMDGFLAGRPIRLQESQAGTLATVPDLPKTTDAQATAQYIRDVMTGTKMVPVPIQKQVEHILHLAQAI